MYESTDRNHYKNIVINHVYINYMVSNVKSYFTMDPGTIAL